jgi:acyl carrier protein
MNPPVSESDPLRQLLAEFFNLPAATPPEDLRQKAVANWDSLAMVQLIAELQSVYGVQFGLDEIEHLGSYAEIRAALLRKGVL